MTIIPGTSQPVQFSKLDIVREHLYASIQMISVGCNSFSTHVVVMACREMVLQLSRHNNIELKWDHRRFIKEEFWSNYHAQAVLAYNYFKHADRDAKEVYAGPAYPNLTHLNDAQTLFNIAGYGQLGGETTKPMKNYSLTMALLYPRYFNMDFLDDYPEHKRQFENHAGGRDVVLSALRSLLEIDNYLPRIPEFA